jgi:(R,R)-butanediol dehydrogenase/meso-butanediol dehydrogenase/diacetyl reductase
VAAVGPGVVKLKAGDRVALCPMIGCMECEWCKADLIGLCRTASTVGFTWHGGGYSPLVNVYEYMCYPVPDSVTDDMSALAGPVAEALHALDRGRLQPGERVAITGGGTIGLMTLQIAVSAGAKDVIVIEPVARRRELALQLGAAIAIDPFAQDPVEAVRELTGGVGADLVVECSGAGPAGMQAVKMARSRGRVVVIGVFEQPAQLDYLDLVLNEKVMMGTVTGYGFFRQAVELLAQGKVCVDPLVTGRICLDELPAMLATLSESSAAHLKVMVYPR